MWGREKETEGECFLKRAGHTSFALGVRLTYLAAKWRRFVLQVDLPMGSRICCV